MRKRRKSRSKSRKSKPPKGISHRIKSALFKDPNKVSFKEGVQYHPIVGGIALTVRKVKAKRKPKAKPKRKNPCPKATTIHLKRKRVKIKIKKGALSKELRIPEAKNIPKTLLLKIKGTNIPKGKKSKTIRNPTKSGKRNVKVTSTTKKRASLALTLKRFKKS